MQDDVIVVGLGAMGAAVLYQLAAAGVAATGIDRFVPPHAMGSSHGDSRITRQAVGEGAAYAPLVMRAHEIWRQLEAETGETLLMQVGALIISSANGMAVHHGASDFVRSSAAVAHRYAIPHETLDAAEIAARFPQFALQGDEYAYYEPGAGLVRPERCIAAQLMMAARHGATVRTGETVRSVVPDGAGVCVTTDQGIYRASRAVMAAGAWMPTLLAPPLARPLTVTRQVLQWFVPSAPEMWACDRTPVFMWMHGPREEDYLYGFPILPGTEGVKVAGEQYLTPTTADAVDRTVGGSETEAMYRDHIAGRLNGLTPACLRSATCLYTATPDRGFMVGPDPEYPQITLVSACSGHGFKHSAGLGEAVARSIVGGGNGTDLSAFAVSRLVPSHVAA